MTQLPPGFLGVCSSVPDELERYGAWATRAGAHPVLAAMDTRLYIVGDGVRVLPPVSGRSCIALLAGEVYGSGVATAALETAIAKHGAEAGPALEGLFALALHGEQVPGLALYSDPTGGRPIYYDARGESLCFGTRPGHVTAVSSARPALSPTGLDEYLRFLDVTAPRTVFAGVSALEPGAQLTWHRGRMVMHPASAGTVDGASIHSDYERAAGALESVLIRALQQRLPEVGPCAVFLSGGVDSSLLLALAAAIAPGRITAVTVGFDQERCDESGAAARIAAALNVPHRLLRYSLDEYTAAFPHWIAATDFPFGDPAALPTLLAFRACRETHAVALDGTGADTLAGIMPARHVRIATEYVARLPRGVRSALAAVVARFPRLAAYRPIFAFDDPESLLIRWQGFERREIEALTGRAVSLQDSAFYRLYRTFPRSAHIERYSALLAALPDDRVHQAALATGLSLRLPFLDRAVRALMKSLPIDFRYRANAPKRILRTLLARRLPQSLWDVPKHGFDFPLVEFLRHRDHALVRRYAAGSPAAGLDAEIACGHVQDFLDGDDNSAFRVWALVVLNAWCGHHLGSRS